LTINILSLDRGNIDRGGDLVNAPKTGIVTFYARLGDFASADLDRSKILIALMLAQSLDYRLVNVLCL
jgi:hypothetical protein